MQPIERAAPQHATSQHDAVSHHYDELDLLYRQIWGEHVHHGLWVRGDETRQQAVRLLVDLVGAVAELSPGDRVVDVGSGYGASARRLAADFGVDVTAVTLSPVQHAYACRQSTGHHAPTYILGNWLENDLPEDSYDAAYAIESISHMADLRRCVEEVRRVLRPGGRFVICAWTAAEKPTNRQIRYLLDPIRRDGRLAHLSTVTHYTETLENAGFVIEEFRDLTDSVRATWAVALRCTAAALLSQPSLLRTLARSGSEQRTFLTTMVRIWIAYRTGAMRYGLLKARLP